MSVTLVSGIMFTLRVSGRAASSLRCDVTTPGHAVGQLTAHAGSVHGQLRSSALSRRT